MATTADFDRLAQEIRDNDETTFTFQEAQGWSGELGLSEARPSLVIQNLKARGLTMVERRVPKRIRTLGSNPHDRWQASPTHGGGGGSSISGIAGAEG